MAYLRDFLGLAPPTGLEPVTSWLTVKRSTDWAMEECRLLNCVVTPNVCSTSLSAPTDILINSQALYRLSYGGIWQIEKSEMPFSTCICNGVFLSSRAVASQVFSTQMSLTSVFGMGTGGTSSQSSPTKKVLITTSKLNNVKSVVRGNIIKVKPSTD